MGESKAKSEQAITEADVEWAYSVLSSVKEAMDKAAGDLMACNQLMGELVNQLPDILEAFIILVNDEHRQMVAEVVGSWTKMMSSLRKT